MTRNAFIEKFDKDIIEFTDLKENLVKKSLLILEERLAIVPTSLTIQNILDYLIDKYLFQLDEREKREKQNFVLYPFEIYQDLDISELILFDTQPKYKLCENLKGYTKIRHKLIEWFNPEWINSLEKFFPVEFPAFIILIWNDRGKLESAALFFKLLYEKKTLDEKGKKKLLKLIFFAPVYQLSKQEMMRIVKANETVGEIIIAINFSYYE